jgi:deoxyribodipyrimidine photo-lyase
MKARCDQAQPVKRPTLVWFRRDLRLHDNPALWFAVKRGRPVIPVFVYSPEEEGSSATGNAAQWWLNESLRAFAAALRTEGAQLVLRRGPVGRCFKQLCEETGADAVYWNRAYEPDVTRIEDRVALALRTSGYEVKTFNGSLLFDPAGIRNLQGKPFRVFTPFWRHCLKQEVDEPFPKPALRGGQLTKIHSLELEDLAIAPKAGRVSGFAKAWKPGEKGARERLDQFLRKDLLRYLEGRDFPAREGVSRLSPHIHFGEIGIREVRAACRTWAADDRTGARPRQADGFLRQLGWREFSRHVLFHFPETIDQPLRREFEQFPWQASTEELRRWQEGTTGYPVVDAGMRQLKETGWMHNRARMIVASFLVKHLLGSWQEGAAWFADNLVDADLANNTMGWQWSAGCGADSAPYFRIFNPTLQGRRFDPEGDYVRRWVPELARLPSRWIHEPSQSPRQVLADSGVLIGTDYLLPMVDHRQARERALAAFRKIR